MKIGGDPDGATRPRSRPASSTCCAATPPDVPRIKADATLGPLVRRRRSSCSTTGASTLVRDDVQGQAAQPGPDGQQALPSRAVDGDRQGHHDGDRLRWPGRRCRQPDPARHARPSARHRAQVRRRGGQGRARDGAPGARLRRTPPMSRPCHSASTPMPATRSLLPTCRSQWLEEPGHQERAQGRHVRHLRRRAPAAQVLDRPERLGRGLPAPGQLPPGAVPAARAATTTRGTTTPTFDKPGRPRPAPSRTPTRQSPLYNQAQELLVEDAPAVFTRWRIWNNEIRPWVKGVAPTGQDSIVMGDLFFEKIWIAKH